MNKTKIEWVKNPDGSQGYTLNPFTGCKNHTPEGLCLGGMFPCYAFKLANGRLKPLYLANKNIAPIGTMIKGGAMNMKALADPFYPRFWPERLMDKDLGNPFDPSYARMKPKGIFVCDMSDLFGIGIPEGWRAEVFTTIASHPYDRFYLLTKQPQNLIKWSPFPENCWVGVTATNNLRYLIAIDHLSQIKATVKFISFEPLLHKIGKDVSLIEGIDRVIIGACTGTKYKLLELCQKWNIEGINQGTQLMQYRGNLWTLQPRSEWVKEIVEAADKAGIPVFLKDNLAPLLNPMKLQELKASFAPFYTEDFELRQETPEK